MEHWLFLMVHIVYLPYIRNTGRNVVLRASIKVCRLSRYWRSQALVLEPGNHHKTSTEYYTTNTDSSVHLAGLDLPQLPPVTVVLFRCNFSFENIPSILINKETKWNKCNLVQSLGVQIIYVKSFIISEILEQSDLLQMLRSWHGKCQEVTDSFMETCRKIIKTKYLATTSQYKLKRSSKKNNYYQGWPLHGMQSVGPYIP